MNARVLVIGAGVGGISAALWLHDRHIAFDWVEATRSIGGTLRRVGNPIDELAGLRAHSGPDLIERYRLQLQALGLWPTFERRVKKIRPAPKDRVHTAFEGGEEAHYDAVLLCTGTTPRMLDLAHEDALLGHGVELSVTRTRHRYKNKPVVAVGGGDAALEGLLLLTHVTDTLHLVHRRTHFRAQPRFVRAIEAHPNIQIHRNERVTKLVLNAEHSALRGVELQSGKHLPAEGLFVRIGVRPNYPDGLIDTTTPKPYLPDDGHGRGPIPGTYIVGDVGTRHHQSVAWAMGSAARAVLTLYQDLLRRDENAHER